MLEYILYAVPVAAVIFFICRLLYIRSAQKRISREFYKKVRNIDELKTDTEDNKSSANSFTVHEPVPPPCMSQSHCSSSSFEPAPVPSVSRMEMFTHSGNRLDCAKVSQVQFSAVAPKKISKGEYSVISVCVYEDEYRNAVDKLIQNSDVPAKEIVGSSKNVVADTNIRIVLSSPDIEISGCDETQVWQGKYLTYNFITDIPAEYSKKQVLFIASVYFNGVIATTLKFIVSCAEENPDKIIPERKDISTAFVSYSSRDRFLVSTVIQGMRKARPELDIYCDIEKLHSGDIWQETLFREIENRDILFLCWSHNAKNSREVEKEWRYALKTKGIDGIDPIPLVSPMECPPPEELKSKHFNDIALLYRSM